MKKFGAFCLSFALMALAAMPALAASNASQQGGKVEHVHGYTTHSGKHVNGYTRHEGEHHSSSSNGGSGSHKHH